MPSFMQMNPLNATRLSNRSRAQRRRGERGILFLLDVAKMEEKVIVAVAHSCKLRNAHQRTNEGRRHNTMRQLCRKSGSVPLDRWTKMTHRL